jgi:hypothetical protein
MERGKQAFDSALTCKARKEDAISQHHTEKAADLTFFRVFKLAVTTRLAF